MHAIHNEKETSCITTHSPITIKITMSVIYLYLILQDLKYANTATDFLPPLNRITIIKMELLLSLLLFYPTLLSHMHLYPNKTFTFSKCIVKEKDSLTSPPLSQSINLNQAHSIKPPQQTSLTSTSHQMGAIPPFHVDAVTFEMKSHSKQQTQIELGK